MPSCGRIYIIGRVCFSRAQLLAGETFGDPCLVELVLVFMGAAQPQRFRIEAWRRCAESGGDLLTLLGGNCSANADECAEPEAEDAQWQAPRAALFGAPTATKKEVMLCAGCLATQRAAAIAADFDKASVARPLGCALSLRAHSPCVPCFCVASGFCCAWNYSLSVCVLKSGRYLIATRRVSQFLGDSTKTEWERRWA